MEKQKCPEIRFGGFGGDWEETILGDVVDIVGGGTPDTNMPEFWNGNIDWYSPTEIGSQVYANGSIKKITELGLKNSSAKILPAKKTVLFSSRAGIGDMAILNKQAATNQGFQSFIANNIDVYFLYSMGFKIKKFALSKASGSTFLEISKNQLAQMAFLSPSLDSQEQTAIGNFFQQLDQSIVLQQQKYTQTQNLKKAMLEKMFPKAGTKQPEIRIKGFGGDWVERSIGELTKVSSAARVHKEEWALSGVPFFRSSDVVSSYKGNDNSKAFISSSLFEKLIQISGRLEKDDLLLTGGGSIGIPYKVPNNEPLYSKDADLIWVKNSATFDSQYLYTFFSTNYFRKYIASISHIGTIAHYTIEQVKATPVCLPSIDEQTAIGQFFKQLDDTLALQQQQLQTLKNLKHAFLAKMFV